jgi:hypothetical protein
MFERHFCICIETLKPSHIPRLTERICRDDDVRPPDRNYVLMEVRNHLMLAFYMMKAQRHKMQYHRGCHGLSRIIPGTDDSTHLNLVLLPTMSNALNMSELSPRLLNGSVLYLHARRSCALIPRSSKLNRAETSRQGAKPVELSVLCSRNK